MKVYRFYLCSSMTANRLFPFRVASKMCNELTRSAMALWYWLLAVKFCYDNILNDTISHCVYTGIK